MLLWSSSVRDQDAKTPGPFLCSRVISSREVNHSEKKNWFVGFFFLLLKFDCAEPIIQPIVLIPEALQGS